MTDDQKNFDDTRQQSADGDRSASTPILLADLTSPELAAMIDSLELIVIPVGAHEQHGPALPFATDTLIAQTMATLVGTLLRPRIAIAPVIPWGVSRLHMAFPGTISLRESTLIDVVLDVITSLHQHGFERFLIINTHGGNNATLRVAAERAHFEFHVPVVAAMDAYTLVVNAAQDVLGEEAIGHGGGEEAAAVFVARPDLVRTALLVNPTLNEPIRRVQSLMRAVGGVFPVAQQRVSENGAVGDSTGASHETGSAIVTRAATQLRAIIEELLDVQPDEVKNDYTSA